MIKLTRIRITRRHKPTKARKPSETTLWTRTKTALAWTPNDPNVEHLPLITRILSEVHD
jgi:hypothetical protein